MFGIGTAVLEVRPKPAASRRSTARTKRFPARDLLRRLLACDSPPNRLIVSFNPKLAAKLNGQILFKMFRDRGRLAIAPASGDSSFLYRFRKTSLLIDCGETVSGGFKASGLNYDTIDRIFYFAPALEGPHRRVFHALMQGSGWSNGKRNCRCTCQTRKSIKLFRQMLNAAFIFPELLQFKLRFRAVADGPSGHRGQGAGDGLSHDAPGAICGTRSRNVTRRTSRRFSFLIETGKLRIGHSADIWPRRRIWSRC